MPELHLRDQQMTTDLYRALYADALQSTKPLLNSVSNPAFDNFYANGLSYLPYSKGKGHIFLEDSGASRLILNIRLS